MSEIEYRYRFRTAVKIREGKDISGRRHGVAAKRPAVRCMVAAENIISNQIAHETSLRDKKTARGRLLEIQ